MTNHYHFITGTTERCTSSAREAFKVATDLTAGGAGGAGSGDWWRVRVPPRVTAPSICTWTRVDLNLNLRRTGLPQFN